MSGKLFREEALNFQHERLWGQCLELNPLGMTGLTGIIVLLVLTSATFLLNGDYQRKAVVSGVLVSDKGAVKIRAPTGGFVEGMSVGNGERVDKGDTLLVIRRDGAGYTKNSVAKQLQAENSRQQALLKKLLKGEAAAFSVKREQLRLEISNLDRQSQALARIASNEAALLSLLKIQYQRLLILADKKLAAAADLDEARVQLLKQESSLRQVNMELDNNRQAREEGGSRQELMFVEHQQQITRLDNELGELKKQQLQLQSEELLRVVSPVNGTVAVLARQDGQAVRSQEILLSVIQENSSVQAELYVPSRAIGFVRQGMPVNIRIDAFPYQKFGVRPAQVKDISQDILLPSESDRAMRMNEPVYRVTAAVGEQFIDSSGQKTFLKPGMQFSADIVLETRTLLEWLLEPLFMRGGSG